MSTEENFFDQELATKTEQPPTIKPCPFCNGQTSSILRRDLAGGELFAVFCPLCDARGPKRTTELESVLAWNHRTTKEPLQ